MPKNPVHRNLGDNDEQGARAPAPKHRPSIGLPSSSVSPPVVSKTLSQFDATEDGCRLQAQTHMPKHFQTKEVDGGRRRAAQPTVKDATDHEDVRKDKSSLAYAPARPQSRVCQSVDSSASGDFEHGLDLHYCEDGTTSNDEGDENVTNAMDRSPGAVAVRGIGYHSDVSDVGTEQESSVDTGRASRGGSPGLAQAVAIDAELAEAQAEQKIQRMLDEAPRAEIIPNGPQMSSKFKNRKWYLLVGLVILVLTVIGLVVGFLVNNSDDQTTSFPGPGPASAPTELPTSTPTGLVDVFQERLEEEFGPIEPGTPQAEALAWLVESDSHQLQEDVSFNVLKERYVLTVLYFATNGDKWASRRGFLGPGSVCSWHGLPDSGQGSGSAPSESQVVKGAFCGESDDSIVSVSLARNNLNGTLPSELSALTALTELDFGANQLSGTIHASLGELILLKELRLEGNILREGIPAALFDLAELQVLDASFNPNLSGTLPDNLGNSTMLQELVLANCKGLRGSIPATISRLANLEVLDLSGSSFEGNVSGLFTWPKLRILKLDGNSLSGELPAELGYLPRLEHLDLSRNRFEGHFPSLLNSTRLLTLQLADNKFSGNLEHLSWVSLVRLQELDLGDNKITGLLPTSIGLLTNLVRLQLNENLLEGPLPSQIGDILNLTRSLNLEFNELTGEIPTELGRLVHLERLNMGMNRHIGPIPSEIGQLTGLVSLNVQQNLMNGTVPTELATLSKLEELLIAGNNFDGSLDMFFCERPDRISDFRADCLGSAPTINCSCCTVCCSTNGDDQECEERLDLRGRLEIEFPGSPFDDPSSPQARTLDWITNVDQMQLVADINTPFRTLKERYTVALLYLATDGANWDNQLGFLGDSPICSWNDGQVYSDASDTSTSDLFLNYGVFCGDNDFVFYIYLDSNGLQGRLPTEIVALESLEYLDLGYNELRGSVPAFQNPFLSYISLSYNGLTGTIPNSIGELAALNFISFDGNDLEGPIPLFTGSTSLSTIWIASNALTGNLDEFVSFVRSRLELDVDVSDNQLTGTLPTEIGLIRLSSLWVRSNAINGTIPNEIGNLTSLWYLDLAWNELSGTLPSEIGFLTSLGNLDLAWNELSGTLPSEIGLLTELSWLDISRNGINGIIPPEIGRLKFLDSLFLQETLLSGTLPTEVGMLNELRMLNVSSTGVGGNIPTEIGDLFSINVLDLGSNEFDSTIPSEIGLLLCAETLSFSQNQLTGQVPTEIASLSCLETLRLDGNDFESLDQYFCSRAESINEIWADCLEPGSETECSCCAYCCLPDGTECDSTSSRRKMLGTFSDRRQQCPLRQCNGARLFEEGA